MKSVAIVFWIFLLVSNVQKTNTALDDIMYEAEEEIKNSRPRYEYLSSPADDDDETANEVSDGFITFTIDGREEEFVKLQYDIILQKEQYTTLMRNDSSLPPNRARRNAIIEKALLWPNGRIPYTIDNSFNETETIIIGKAIDMWRVWTCLTFFKASNNDFNNIHFKKTKKGCGESQVGMVRGNQSINISHKCSTSVRVVAHEIGHAIGLYHEQMRNDRDTYLTVHYDNIINTKMARKNFEVMTQYEYEDFSKPYDYLSIMHYGKLFYSRDRKAELVTLSPINEYYLNIIGEVQTISYLDAKIVCQLYNCAARGSSKCNGTSFKGAEGQCVCEGPSDKNPIIFCPIEESCTMPTIDYSKYVVLNELYVPLPKKSGPFKNDTEFYVVWNDKLVDACGMQSSMYRCHNAVWIGHLPECNQGCVVNTNWKQHYNICEYNETNMEKEAGVADIEMCDPDDKYEDKANITLICKSDITMMATSQCNNGSWTTFCLNCPNERSNVNDVTPYKMSVPHAPGYFFVTAPNMFRYKTDENVLVSVFDRSDADIIIWLEYDYFKNGEQKTKQFSRKSVLVHNQENPRLETIRVDEHDLFGPCFDAAIEKPGQLRLVASDGTTQKKVDIMLSYDSGYLIVHTDKPIYTPRQKVSVRVLALDESMSNALAMDKIDTQPQVVLDLVNPSGKIMSRAYGRPSKIRGKTPFYTSVFDIPANTELGTWTIVTNLIGQFETSERTMFEVEEYVLPTMNVTVTTNISYILETTEHFEVKVEAKSVYRKPVVGSVGLTFFLNNAEDQEQILNQPRTQMYTYGYYGIRVFTINVKDIVNSDLRRKKGRFPTGEYLTIRADVYESATGNEETGWNTDMIFADKPYKFTYERSKLHFRPGWAYFFKVDVLLPNGNKANNVEIRVNSKQGGMVKSRIKTTDNIGQCNIPFSTIGSTQTDITFEVNVDGVIDTFVVKSYIGAHQVNIEHIEIMSRGKIIEWKYTDSTFENRFELEKEILTKIAPTARVLVFYVANNAVVADSVKFDVEAVCRGKELKITTEYKAVEPGSTRTLTIEGPSDMIVGLNVMDTALLQLNSENILRRTKMFKAMASHDRGCGESSGSTVEEVFKNSGLTLVTDAAIANNKLKRTYVKCHKHNRRNRSLGVSSRQIRSSLDGKSEYNIDLDKLKGSRPRQRKNFHESWLFTDVDLEDGQARISMNFFHLRDGQARIPMKFPDTMTQWMIQAIGFSPRDGICIANPLYVKADKDFFIQLDLPYQAVRLERINVKATIFNYGFKGQNDKTINVYLHGQEDMCSAARPGQTSEMVQLRIAPNTAQTVTFPVIPLKRSPPGKQLTIEVTAIAEGALVNDAISKSLYIINEGIEKQKMINVCLDPGREKDDCESSSIVESYFDNTDEQRQTITIDLSLPKDAIPNTGSAIAYINSNMMVDVVEAIVNGIEKLLRMPYGNAESNMGRLAPTIYAMNYLKQTKQVTDTIEQDGNKAIRAGVTREMWFRKHDGSYAAWWYSPSSTWLTAFVAKVFCQVKTVVDDAVDEALHIAPSTDWLANQILADGSFDDKHPVSDMSMLGQVSEKDETLTAFVLISLLECQKKSNEKAQNEVTNKAQKYIESLDVYRLIRNPYLLAISAYALSLTDSSEKGTFWELLKYTKHINEANTYWGDITPPGTVANADTVETTSYALLTYLSYNQLGEAGHIVRWLTSQRNAEGSFRTTQETVIGLQALSEYSILTSSTEVNLQLTFSADGWKKSGHTETVTKENINVLKIVDNLPVETKDNQLVIYVTGSGSARMEIDLRYNIPKPDSPCAFKVSEIDIKPVEISLLDRDCDVCGYCKEPENPNFGALEDDHTRQAESSFGRRKREVVASKNTICMSFSVSLRYANQPESGMSIVKVNLQTGIQAIESDLRKLQEKGIIDRYELTYNNQGFIVFYLDKIEHDAKEFKFRLIDKFDGDADTRQGSSVDVYDYYRPDRSCQLTYGFGDDRGPLKTTCSGDYKQACNCVQKLCTAKPDLDYFKNPRKYRPVAKLIQRTCDSEVADYSILVLITKTFVDGYEKKAHAAVLRVFSRGAEALVENVSDVTFTWKMDCMYPDFVKGKKYYVIANDGPRTNTDGTTGYTYPLKDKAFVIEQMNGNDKTLRKVFVLMRKYERDMTNAQNMASCIKNKSIDRYAANTVDSSSKDSANKSVTIACGLTDAENTDVEYKETRMVYAKSNAWPWMVGLYDVHYELMCGGSLIDRQWILTAAHCVERRTRIKKVHIGQTSRGQGSHYVENTVDRIFVHEKYRQHGSVNQDFLYNIALVKLEKPVTYEGHSISNVAAAILPVCLYDEDKISVQDYEALFAHNQYGIVTGWGFAGYRPYERSVHLKQMHMQVKSHDACLQNLDPQNKRKLNDTLMFCAGGTDSEGNVIDTCMRDRGGPFVVESPYEKNTFIQTGIVSFGFNGGCFQEGIYGVYTKLTLDLVTWIKTTKDVHNDVHNERNNWGNNWGWP